VPCKKERRQHFKFLTPYNDPERHRHDSQTDDSTMPKADRAHCLQQFLLLLLLLLCWSIIMMKMRLMILAVLSL